MIEIVALINFALAVFYVITKNFDHAIYYMLVAILAILCGIYWELQKRNDH